MFGRNGQVCLKYSYKYTHIYSQVYCAVYTVLYGMVDKAIFFFFFFHRLLPDEENFLLKFQVGGYSQSTSEREPRTSD